MKYLEPYQHSCPDCSEPMRVIREGTDPVVRCTHCHQFYVVNYDGDEVDGRMVDRTSYRRTFRPEGAHGPNDMPDEDGPEDYP